MLGSREILRSLMNPDVEHEVLWQPGELPLLLKQQLDAPLESDLDALSDEEHPAHAELREALAKSGLKTFRELFHHADPPLALLTAVKNFAKHLMSSRDEAFPQEVARVLYTACLLKALSAGHRRFTRLSPASIQQSAAWCLAQPWIDAATRKMISSASRRVGS